jgi:hypothetical protein
VSDAELVKIAQRFKEKLAKHGMELDGAEPASADAPATISIYVHTQDCASRRKQNCDCRDTQEAHE